MCDLTDKAWQVRALCAVLLVLYDLIRTPWILPFSKICHRLSSTVVPMTVVFSAGLAQQRCRSPGPLGYTERLGWPRALPSVYLGPQCGWLAAYGNSGRAILHCVEWGDL